MQTSIILFKLRVGNNCEALPSSLWSYNVLERRTQSEALHTCIWGSNKRDIHIRRLPPRWGFIPCWMKKNWIKFHSMATYQLVSSWYSRGIYDGSGTEKCFSIWRWRKHPPRRRRLWDHRECDQNIGGRECGFHWHACGSFRAMGWECWRHARHQDQSKSVCQCVELLYWIHISL